MKIIKIMLGAGAGVLASYLLIIVFANAFFNEPLSILEETKAKSIIHKVNAIQQTTPVTSKDDAADDPCVWINQTDLSQSLIIGTNKKEGIEVYNLQGKRIASYPIGRVNNVDIRYDFKLGDTRVDIVVATNRTRNCLSVFRVDKENNKLQLLSDSSLQSHVDEVYGFALGQPKADSVLYALVVSKSGLFEQWVLNGDSGKVTGEIVRSFDFNGTCEGIVVDDYTGQVYLGAEDKGIWKFDINPSSSITPELIVSIDSIPNLVEDIEGLSIYYSSEKEGYLIASSQGNNTYAIFERQAPHTYLGSFEVVDSSGIDGSQETDGLDVVNQKLPGYPNGFLIVQDGYNFENGNPVNQNFKIIDWAGIAKSYSPELKISPGFLK